jgi:diguanylate cyclase (GGDEF)-like protein
LTHAVAISERSKSHGALLFFDLDNFKAVNDKHGHGAGDDLLRQTAQRLQSCTRMQDTVSRSGGDEFVIILEGLSHVAVDAASQADAVGRKILAAINAPYALDVGLHNVTASIGIVLFCKQEQTPDDLMQRADLALYGAKTAGRNRHLFFDPAMQARLIRRNAIEADLRQSLEKNQFELHYQTQVDSSGATTGVEALLRMRHPEKGLIMPAVFVEVAEETGLIIELGFWVLEAACRQLHEWSTNSETSHLTMSVNVSARQFNHQDFTQRVLEILERSGANARCLILELTESLMLDEVDVTIEKMIALRTTGLRFSLDDFGTGYSSLSYLKRLPLYEIKIDRSFVRDLLQDANDAVIVRAIIALGQSFGLSIIAEGVEDKAQRDFLETSGCKRFQGYLFARPVPIAVLMTTAKAFS